MNLSIIIPVYNVEKYLEKCLLSCVKQDVFYENYEIIVVNDGSPDNSQAIAERIAKQYSNIKIICQNNQGLSAARNIGMKYAKGEYIWFIDSDDYIEENCLGRIFTLLKDELDILQIKYRHVYEDNTPPTNIKLCYIEGIKTGKEVIDQSGLPAPAQFSIFRLKFLRENKLEFFQGIYHEDSEFKPKATYLAKKISSDKYLSYNYLQRLSGSITSNFKLKNGLDILIVINSLLDFIEEQKVPLKERKYFYKQISKNINTLLYGIRQLPNNDKTKLICHLKKNKHIFNCMTNSGILKYLIEGVFFSINIRLGLFLHNYIR